jgi:hypothetical protein
MLMPRKARAALVLGVVAGRSDDGTVVLMARAP